LESKMSAALSDGIGDMVTWYYYTKFITDKNE
jgi:hypothetical protein